MSYPSKCQFFLSAREIMGCLHADTHWALMTDSEGERCLGYFESGQLMSPASQSPGPNWLATRGVRELDVGFGELPYYLMQLTERSPAAFRLGPAALNCWWQAASAELTAKRASGQTSNCAYDDEHFVIPPRPWPQTMQDWQDQRCRLERRHSIAIAGALWHRVTHFARQPERAAATAISLTDRATGALRDEIAQPLHPQVPTACRSDFFRLVGADLLRFVQQAGSLTVGDRVYRVKHHVLTGTKPEPADLALINVTLPAERLPPPVDPYIPRPPVPGAPAYA